MRNQFHNIKNRKVGIAILAGVLVVVALFVGLYAGGLFNQKNALNVNAQANPGDWQAYTTYNQCMIYSRETSTSLNGVYGTISNSCDRFTELQYGNYTIVYKASTTYVTSGP